MAQSHHHKTTRDPRWEKVRAFEDVQFPSRSDPVAVQDGIYTKYILEVTVGKKVFYATRRVLREDLVKQPGLFNIIMSELVALVDQKLADDEVPQ